MSNVIDGVSHHTIYQLPQNFKNAFRLFPTALLAFKVHFNSENTGELAHLFLSCLKNFSLDSAEDQDKFWCTIYPQVI